MKNLPVSQQLMQDETDSVQNQEKKAILDAIVDFAQTHGGSSLDKDPELEKAGIETLRSL